MVKIWWPNRYYITKKIKLLPFCGIGAAFLFLFFFLVSLSESEVFNGDQTKINKPPRPAITDGMLYFRFGKACWNLKWIYIHLSKFLRSFKFFNSTWSPFLSLSLASQYIFIYKICNYVCVQLNYSVLLCKHLNISDL